MLNLGIGTQIVLATEPVDLRRGHDGLISLVRSKWSVDAYSGTLFVFLGRRGDRAKVLFFERGGFVVYYKRLERGRFVMPPIPEGATSITLDGAALSISLTHDDGAGCRRQRMGTRRRQVYGCVTVFNPQRRRANSRCTQAKSTGTRAGVSFGPTFGNNRLELEVAEHSSRIPHGRGTPRALQIVADGRSTDANGCRYLRVVAPALVFRLATSRTFRIPHSLRHRVRIRDAARLRTPPLSAPRRHRNEPPRASRNEAPRPLGNSPRFTSERVIGPARNTQRSGNRCSNRGTRGVHVWTDTDHGRTAVSPLRSRANWPHAVHRWPAAAGFADFTRQTSRHSHCLEP